MTDRELLELAAKAAGEIPIDFVGNAYYMEGFMSVWHPLTDDADALRLAVDLGLRIRIELDPVGFTEICLPNTGWYSAPVYHNDDRYAATRRAIVRAAAEIGERMK